MRPVGAAEPKLDDGRPVGIPAGGGGDVMGEPGTEVVAEARAEEGDERARSRLDEVTLFPRIVRSDDRGWFLKVIEGNEPHLPPATGEVYLTLTLPGRVRGGHYHVRTAEWFTIVLGRARVALTDPKTGDRRDFDLSAESPTTLYVPAGIGHSFTNLAEDGAPMLLVAYADRPYDPADTVVLDAGPPTEGR
jgi:dTDP-4-dehydrorhamnose 3,5-epimerase-like enzyme